MRKIVLSIFTILMLSFSLSAQNQRVSGTVTDESGQALIGVSVIQKGTQNAVVTGIDGQYSTNVPGNSILVFASLGYTEQEVNVSGRTLINVIMAEDVTDAGEVIVIGYGTGQKLGNVTGDVSVVSSDIVKDKPTANIADALQGQVSGLSVMTASGEPSEASTIILHGIGSMTASSSPLIVIDGMPSAAGVLQRMSNNDIENITVLKDASATSIYGSRAANGVIYVTTKKGRKDLPPSIRIAANYSLSQPARNGRHMMSGADLLDWQLEFGEINPEQYLAFKERNDRDGDFDWFDYFFPTKHNYKVDFSVQGGSETTNYYVSGGYQDTDGLAPASYLKTYTFRLNLGTDIRPWLKFSTNIGLSYDENSAATRTASGDGAIVSAPGFAAIQLPSYRYPTDEDGNKIVEIIPGTVPFRDPYAYADMWPDKSDNLYFNGTAELNINPVKGLNINSRFGVEVSDYTRAAHIDPRWNEIQPDSGQRIRSFSRGNTFLSTNTIEYKFSLKNENVHNFSFLAGHEGEAYSYQSFAAQSLGHTDSRLMLIGSGIFASIDNVAENFSEYNYLSGFGRVSYNYKEKYSFDGSFRNDASSRFGRDVRNAPFWSAGLLWNMKKENFLANNRTITDLTFRTTYGTQGNSEIGFYSHLGVVGPIGNDGAYKNEAGWVILNPGNPRLTWEKQRKFNASVDIGLWKKLNISVSYFHRLTTDMLMDVPVSATTGFISAMMNVGKLLNQNVDVDFNYSIFQNRDWNVNVSANFSYNKNEILELFPGTDEIAPAGYYMIDKVGKPIDTYYTPISLGVDSRDGYEIYLDENGNPTKDASRAAFHVSDKGRWAPYNGGFNINAAWKGLALLTNFSWRAGSYLNSNEAYFLEGPQFELTARPDYMMNLWRKPGDISDIPGNHAPMEMSSRHLENTSFLRLKSVTLSYDLPKNLMDKVGFIQGARVFFIGRNLLTFSTYKGYDPEPFQGQWALGEYPTSREFAFGLELTF